ncbi:hypothetical protein JTE90_011158 [Oedothorax gibbosus]|uniref:Uncharacterized protein n=1 Tax=Oedothorax gibbosus TaxID=931172 RepID=A0AAV6TI27_9ARAC|nr:hypothetical protein JTE90_011158 [Oedothorax gibbosus]
MGHRSWVGEIPFSQAGTFCRKAKTLSRGFVSPGPPKGNGVNIPQTPEPRNRAPREPKCGKPKPNWRKSTEDPGKSYLFFVRFPVSPESVVRR